MSAGVTRADQVVPPATAWSRVGPHVTGWLFALPFVIVFAVFLAIPILASFVLSFTNFGIANLQSWFSADLIGLDNYTKLFDD